MLGGGGSGREGAEGGSDLGEGLHHLSAPLVAPVAIATRCLGRFGMHRPAERRRHLRLTGPLGVGRRAGLAGDVEAREVAVRVVDVRGRGSDRGEQIGVGPEVGVEWQAWVPTIW